MLPFCPVFKANGPHCCHLQVMSAVKVQSYWRLYLGFQLNCFTANGRFTLTISQTSMYEYMYLICRCKRIGIVRLTLLQSKRNLTLQAYEHMNSNNTIRLIVARNSLAPFMFLRWLKLKLIPSWQCQRSNATENRANEPCTTEREQQTGNCWPDPHFPWTETSTISIDSINFLTELHLLKENEGLILRSMPQSLKRNYPINAQYWQFVSRTSEVNVPGVL